ncbi:MAG TPA: class I SAM-dependent methyltransferase, partial [bacterium]|nr:class I SAM-dependent methyltransferase [bacterium]
MNDDSFEQMHLTGRNYWWYQAKEHLMKQFLKSAGGLDAPSGRPWILDMGCGTGTMFGFLAEQGVLVGLDPSPRAIEYARQRGIAYLVRGDAADAPFAEKSFHLISLFDALEHIEDDRAVLHRAHALLADDGVVLVTVPAFQWLHSWRETQLGHRRRYTIHSLRRLLASTGFEVSVIRYMYAGLFPLLILKSLKDRIISPPKTFKSDIVMLSEPWNSLLARWFRVEADMCHRIGLPFGTSVVALARRIPVDSAGEIHK